MMASSPARAMMMPITSRSPAMVAHSAPLSYPVSGGAYDQMNSVKKKKKRSIGATLGGFLGRSAGLPVRLASVSRLPVHSADGATTSSDRTETPPAAPTPFDLIKLQSFDGSFVMDNSFVGIVGKQAADKYQDLNLSKPVWATILAIAYLQIHLTNQPELLDGLVEKATEFILESGLPAGIDLDTLLVQAKETLRSDG